VPDSPPPVRHGRIIYAWIADRNGFTKLRPAIVLTPEDEIAEAEQLSVMAITTTFPNPPPPFCVPLPWHPRAHPTTRLHKRSAAVVNWLASIWTDDIIGFGGDVPAKTLHIIHERLNQLRGE
jgi:hypothetical protein